MAHAQISDYYIPFLYLLTRNELVVFCDLLRRRNEKTGQCNPKQSTIVKDTNLRKSRVSEAVVGLEAKGWIIWTESGEFLFPKTVEEKDIKSSVMRNKKSSAKRNSKFRITELGVPQNGTSLIRIEHTKEHTTEQDKKPEIADALSSLPEQPTTIPLVQLPETEKPFADEPQPHERLRFFPMLEHQPLPLEKLNEICGFFTYITEQQKRKTLQKEDEWIKIVRKLELEGMSVNGMKSLYRYGIEVKKLEFLTPKQIDWLFPEYKDFLENGAKPKVQNTSY